MRTGIGEELALKIVTKLLEQGTDRSNVWALWNWNSQTTDHQIEQQVRRLKESGFSGLIVRPSDSITPHYLSDAFNSYFLKLLQVAEEEEIAIMLGDDFSTLPASPFSETLVRQKNHRASRLVLVETKNLEQGEKYSFTPDQHRQEFLVAAPYHSRNRISLEGTKLLYDGEEATSTKWTATKGTWRVIRFAVEDALTVDGDYIPNFYSMKCAQSYINTVLEPLSEIQGKKLSPAFKGIYCEMPPITPSKLGIPWDEELFISKYRSRFKRNLITTIPALFFPVTESDAKYRPHILNFIQDTLTERFPQVVQKWTASKKIDFWFVSAESDMNDLHSSLSPFFTSGGSDYPVIGLRNDTRSVQSEAAITALATMNRDIYKRRTAVVINRNSHMMSATLADAKTEADLAIVNGADLLVIDGFFMNQEYTFSKTTPPGLTFSHPDFNKVTDLVTAIKNTTAVTHEYKNDTPVVAVLYPSQSAMADYTVNDPTVIETVTELFLKTVNELHSHHIPFTILTEQEAVECAVNADATLTHSESKLSINGIILPYSRLINNSLFVMLEKFAVKKGVIVFINESPQGSFDDGVGGSIATRVTKLINAKGKQVHTLPVSALCDYFVPEETEDDHGVTLSSPAPHFRTQYINYDDISALVSRNGDNERIHLSIPAYHSQKFYQLDPTSGKLLKIDNREESDDDFEFTIQPHETVVLVSSAAGAGAIKESLLETTEPAYRIRLRNDRWNFAPNSLNNFPLTRWTTRMSIDRSTGLLSNYFESSFSINSADHEAYLIIPDSKMKSNPALKNKFKVLLNGFELEPIDERIPAADELSSFFDEDNSLLIYSLQEQLERGTNTIRIMKHSTGVVPDPLKYPPIVAIDGPVEQTPKGWKVIPNIDENDFTWGGKGYPYLVGTGTYTHSFEVPQGADKVILSLEKLSGSAEISLNGERIGSLLWPPYRLDITDYVSNKRNELAITVRNSLSPITALSGKESGITGDVLLEMYGALRSDSDEEE